jgi:hypothetical protein
MKVGSNLTRRLVPLLFVASLACGGNDAAAPSGESAVIAEAVSTVAKVTWTTSEPSVGYVEYGVGELTERTPPEPEPVTEHSMTLLGLTADTVYDYRVVTSDGDDTAAGEQLTFRTGDLPVGMPRLTLTGEGHDQFTLVPILGRTTAVTIIDPQGNVVWYHQDDRDLQFYRARLSVDGKSILYNAASVSGDPAENSELVRVALDGSSTTSVAIPLLAHDFVEHPDGTLGAIVVEYREFEGTMLRGDKIVEVSPSGEIRTVWDAWDCFDPATETGDNIELGWTFANALDYDPEEQVYYLGMRNFSSIARVNPATRECEWVLGLTASTFDFAPGSTRVLHQHQFQVRDNRILILDNDGSPGDDSRVLEYELDFKNNLATQVWTYVADPIVYTFVLGEPTRLENGDTFVNWSAAGQLERVTADSRSIWKLNTPLTFAFGFSTLADTLYTDASP